MNTYTAIECRNLPLVVLTESATNPRRIFDDSPGVGGGFSVTPHRPTKWTVTPSPE
ncbi:MAG: hypothetical protein WCA10_09105 [Terracidiphilus sp.]